MTGLAAHIQADNIDFSDIEFTNLIPVSVMSLGFMANAEKLNMPISQMELSVDMDFFSRIYDIAFGEKGNKDMELDNRTENTLAQREEEKEQDNIQNAAEEALNDIQEKRLKELHEFNGFQFTDEDLDEAIQDIINGKKKIQEEYNLTDEESDQLHEHALVISLLSGDEKRDYLDELSKRNPKLANIIAEQAQEVNLGKQEQKIEVEFTEAQEQEHDDFLDFPDDDPIFSSVTPISENFAGEVAATGPNAQSFTPRDPSDMGIKENAPSPLELTG